LTKWFLLLPTKQWPCLLASLEGCKAAASGGSASFRDIGKPEPAVLWFFFSCLHQEPSPHHDEVQLKQEGLSSTTATVKEPAAAAPPLHEYDAALPPSKNTGPITKKIQLNCFPGHFIHLQQKPIFRKSHYKKCLVNSLSIYIIFLFL
jgi:hypothetical protein